MGSRKKKAFGRCKKDIVDRLNGDVWSHKHDQKSERSGKKGKKHYVIAEWEDTDIDTEKEDELMAR